MKLAHFALYLSALNFICFHFPFYGFVFSKVDYKSLHGMVLIVSLVVLMLLANAFTFYLLLFLLRKVGKFLLAFFFIGSAVAVYFVNTYSVIIDESMIGNVFNTKYEEASSFFSLKLIVYLLLFGVVPAIFIFRTKVVYVSWKRFLATMGTTILIMAIIGFANAKNWLWIDKNSKKLGGLAMPWSYAVNTALLYSHKAQANQKEIRLPNAIIKNQEKAVMVLVIGESARSANFSLYGYNRNTNPLLSRIPNLKHYEATSCATYTTAGVKCILEHENSGDLYEILPNYLFRNDVEVVWRTTNWGEPPVHIKNYQTKEMLQKACKGEDCTYDDLLLTGLKEQIINSPKNKVLIILHTTTSHGPTYSKRYPAQFEIFKPVCKSVELATCSQQELINAYDNTIVYTDFLLNKLIGELQSLKDYKSAMMFVSDHGESLGEKNLYMHGVPMSFAPKEQFEIPFIVWTSDSSKHYKPLAAVNQNYVFHSVLNFLDVESPVYNEKMNVFE